MTEMGHPSLKLFPVTVSGQITKLIDKKKHLFLNVSFTESYNFFILKNITESCSGQIKRDES